MRRIFLLVFGLIGVLGIGIRSVAGQVNAPVVQNISHPLVSHGAPRPISPSVAPVSQSFARGPIAVGPRIINSQPAGISTHFGMSPRSSYPSSVRPPNPTLATMNFRERARAYRAQPTSLLASNEFARKRLAYLNSLSGTTDSDAQSTAALTRRDRLQERLAKLSKTRPPESPITTPRDTTDALAPREASHTEPRHNWKGKDNWPNFSDARRCHWHEWHDRNWWCRHFTTIVLVSSGYYFWDAGYWYPAWGYDPSNSYYDYDGPIYTYGNLLPDEVIANIQVALQDAGYYFGPITGSLSAETQAALANFQRDYGLPITGAIDQSTVETLGLNQSGLYQSGDVLNSNY